MSGQAIEEGTVGALVAIAISWYDGRLARTRIVTTGKVEYHARDIERIHWEALGND